MKAAVGLCPQCQKPAVDFSPLAGGAARCRGCGWEGKAEGLTSVPFEHDFASPEAMVAEFTKAVRKELLPFGTPLGVLLVRWGFVDPKRPDLFKRSIVVYLERATLALIRSVFETRDLIAREGLPEMRELGPQSQAKGDPNVH